MAEIRQNPYGAFNFQVSLEDANDPENELIGGFSDASGLGREVNYSEYRNGNELFNTVRKVANTFKQEDVTLKRGLVDSGSIWQWMESARYDGPAAKKTVTHLLDQFGFDTVDAGPLEEGWRIQRDTPGYGPRRTAEELRRDLAAAKRYADRAVPPRAPFPE